MGLILAVLGFAIVLFCLTSRITKIFALVFALACGLMIVVCCRDAEDYQHPERFSKEYVRMLEGRGESLASVGICLQKQTPLEKFGDFLGVISIFTAICAMSIVADINNRSVTRKIGLKCLVLFIVSAIYWLSLYMGLQIGMMVCPAKDKKDVLKKYKRLVLMKKNSFA